MWNWQLNENFYTKYNFAELYIKRNSGFHVICCEIASSMSFCHGTFGPTWYIALNFMCKFSYNCHFHMKYIFHLYLKFHIKYTLELNI